MSDFKKDLELRAGKHPQHVLAATLLRALEDDVLELDELWSFVDNKGNIVWIRLVLCRRTRQVVAWMWGDRREETCVALDSPARLPSVLPKTDAALDVDVDAIQQRAADLRQVAPDLRSRAGAVARSAAQFGFIPPSK